MSECIFCSILEGNSEASIVYKDKLVTAFMDIQPVNGGHVLVIPNNHAAYLADLDEETGAQQFRVAQKIAAAIRKTDILCEGINFFLADGEAANQDVFHVHLHIIPRYVGDGFGFRFGEGYYELPERKSLDIDAEKISSYL